MGDERLLPRIVYDDEYPPREWDGVSAANASAIAEFVTSFLLESATKSDLPFERPRVPLVDRGPQAYAPGWHREGWSVAFEGAYDWPIYFAQLIFEDGFVGKYCEAHGLFIDVATGWSISIEGNHAPIAPRE